MTPVALTGLTGLKVAVVGGASGIGLASMQLLKASGAEAVSVDIAESADIVADISTSGGCEAAVLAVVDRLGGLDALYISAGGGPYASIDETDADLWARTIALNLVSAGLLTRAALPALRQSARASITVTASAAGRQGYGLFTAYSSAKAGLVHWSRSAARELGPQGIRVNCISPGPIDTPLLRAGGPEGVTPEAWKVNLARRTCLGRVGTAEEVANVAVFFLSDLASYVTGTIVEVDGGETA
jgi:NAD(P)-dependent dehydrogenase (short-subunit alcohol dehydrogenase family)